MGIVGIVKWPRGQQEITDSDLLWLARSLGGETSPTETGRAAAAWAMLQRMVWMRDQGHTTTDGMPCSRAPTGRGIPELEPVRRSLDFTGMLRCFSSPVNPFHTDRVAARRARRRFFISASYDQLEQRSRGVKEFVYRFGRGEVPNPVPGAADFDAPGEEPVGARILFRVGGNLFMGEPGFPTTLGYVTIEPARGLQAFPLTTLALVATGVVAAGLLAYFTWTYAMNPRRRRRNAPRKVRYEARLTDEGIEVFAHGAAPRDSPFTSLGADVVGYLRAEVARDAAQVVRIGVIPKLQRKGVATRMYELAAQTAAREFKLPLRSDVSRTEGAEFFWQKQVEKGRARPVMRDDEGLRFYELVYPPPKSLRNNSEAKRWAAKGVEKTKDDDSKMPMMLKGESFFVERSDGTRDRCRVERALTPTFVHAIREKDGAQASCAYVLRGRWWVWVYSE